MNRVINEKDIVSTVRDFETVCSYIVANKLKLTAGGALGKKACFELNSQMAYPVPVEKGTYQMSNYPSIVLYLTIALETGLLEPGEGTGKKAAITMTELYSAFQQMSVYSKYLCIFLAWMRYIDADSLYGHEMNRRWFSPSLIEESFDQISAVQTPGAVYKRDRSPHYYMKEEPLQELMHKCVLLLYHFRDLGLIGYYDKHIVKMEFYRTLLNELWFTELGVILTGACSIRRFSWVNMQEYEVIFDSDEEEEIYENDFKQNPPGSPGFFEPFLSCFPENEIDTEAINQLLFPQAQAGIQSDDVLYEFRVSLSNKCYREILCRGHHTFEDLHLAIQDAFDFDNDHLYSFYLDGKKWSSRSINHPYCDEPPYSDDVLIGGAGLRIKQKILYLFDFGDEWKFNVTLLSIKRSEDLPLHPVISKSVGDAPDQYPSYDDDRDDDWDEE